MNGPLLKVEIMLLAIYKIAGEQTWQSYLFMVLRGITLSQIDLNLSCLIYLCLYLCTYLTSCCWHTTK